MFAIGVPGADPFAEEPVRLLLFFFAVFLEGVLAPDECCLTLLAPRTDAELPALREFEAAEGECEGVPCLEFVVIESEMAGGCGSLLVPTIERCGLRFEGVLGAVVLGRLSALGKGEDGLNIAAAFAIGGWDEKEVLSVVVVGPAFARNAFVKFEVVLLPRPLVGRFELLLLLDPFSSLTPKEEGMLLGKARLPLPALGLFKLIVTLPSFLPLFKLEILPLAPPREACNCFL